MNRIAFVAVLAIGTAFSGASLAYTVKGSVACTSIEQEHSNETYRAMNRWWLLGYFTGRNAAVNADVGLNIGEADIYDVAYAYCLQNSGGDWDDAAVYTYDHFASKR